MASVRSTYFPQLSQGRDYPPVQPRKTNGSDSDQTATPRKNPHRQSRAESPALEPPKLPGVVVFGQINLLHKQIGKDLKAINSGMGDVKSDAGSYPGTLRLLLSRVRKMDEYLVALLEETEAV